MTRRLIPALVASLFCLIGITGLSKADPEPTTRPTTQSSARDGHHDGNQHQGGYGRRGDGFGGGPGFGPRGFGPPRSGPPAFDRMNQGNLRQRRFGQFQGPDGGDNGAAGDGQFRPRRGQTQDGDQSDGVDRQTVARLEAQIAKLSAQLDRMQQELDQRDGRQNGRRDMQQRGPRQQPFDGDLQQEPQDWRGPRHAGQQQQMRRFQEYGSPQPWTGFDGRGRFGRFQDDGRRGHQQFSAPRPWQKGQRHQDGRKWGMPSQQQDNHDAYRDGYGQRQDSGRGPGTMNRGQQRGFEPMYDDQPRDFGPMHGPMHGRFRRLGPPPFMSRFGAPQQERGGPGRMAPPGMGPRQGFMHQDRGFGDGYGDSERTNQQPDGAGWNQGPDRQAPRDFAGGRRRPPRDWNNADPSDQQNDQPRDGDREPQQR